MRFDPGEKRKRVPLQDPDVLFYYGLAKCLGLEIITSICKIVFIWRSIIIKADKSSGGG